MFSKLKKINWLDKLPLQQLDLNKPAPSIPCVILFVEERLGERRVHQASQTCNLRQFLKGRIHNVSPPAHNYSTAIYFLPLANKQERIKVRNSVWNS